MTTDNLIDLELFELHQTEDAFLLWDGHSRGGFHNKKSGKWIPKSVCTANDNGTYTMPESWAFNKGLI